MSDPRLRQTLPRSARIRSHKVFARIFQQELCASDQWMTLHAAPNQTAAGASPPGIAPSQTGGGRLGISVSRRIGGAVRRNRVKRLVREAFRRLRHELPPGVDWIVVPKPGPEPTVPDLQHSIRKLARRLQPRLGLDPAARDR